MNHLLDFIMIQPANTAGGKLGEDYEKQHTSITSI